MKPGAFSGGGEPKTLGVGERKSLHLRRGIGSSEATPKHGGFGVFGWLLCIVAESGGGVT